MKKYSSWTPKEDKKLTELRKQGLYPSQIKKLGHLEGRTIEAVRMWSLHPYPQ